MKGILRPSASDYRGTYDLICSLGEFCDILYQLKRKELRAYPLPFDWMCVPFNALLDALTTDFHNFFEYENLKVNKDRVMEGRHDVHDTRYAGLRAPHHFPILGGEDDIVSTYPEFKSKQELRKAFFRKSMERLGSILFVRHGGTPEEFLRLVPVLEGLRKGKDWHLLAISPDESVRGLAEKDRRVSWQPSPRKALKGVDERSWGGNDKDWDAIFKNVKLRNADPLNEKIVPKTAHRAFNT